MDIFKGRSVVEWKENEANTLYATYLDGIVRYLTVFTNDEELAKDLTQETLIRALQEKLNGRGWDRDEKAYIYRIAHNAAVGHLRKWPYLHIGEAHEESIFRYDDSEKVEWEIDYKSLLEKLRNELPPDQFEVIVLRFLSGLSSQECAKVLNTTDAAIRARQNKALTRARELFKSDFF